RPRTAAHLCRVHIIGARADTRAALASGAILRPPRETVTSPDSFRGSRMSPIEAPRYTRRYTAWMLTLLVLMNALNLADRQGIAASIQAIKLDLHFSDAQLGFIQGFGFAIFYSLMGLPLARLAERYSRSRLIAGCLALFGAMVALCGTARGFFSLLLFRIGVGVGDAGFVTPVSSLIGDYYPSAKRASVMSIIWLGGPLGLIGGLVGAAWLTQ